ncbi:MAG: tetratricopeptide repeat protein [Succinivibrio sp.]
MRNTVNRNKKQTHLLSKTTIALLVATIGVSVYFLTPTSTSLEEKIQRAQSPEVSLVYLQELEKVHPDDPMIPYLRAKIYYDKGNYNKVMDLIAPQIKEDTQKRSTDILILYIKTKIALAGSINNKSRDETLNEVRAEIRAFSNQMFTDSQLREMATVCAQLGMADMAYDFLNRVMLKDDATTHKLYELALQSGNFRAATDYLYEAFLKDENEKNADRLFSLYLQSFDPALFGEFLDKYQGKLKDESFFIRKQIDTSRKLGLYERELDLLKHLCQVEPLDGNFAELAGKYVSTGNYDEASAIYEKLYQNNADIEYLVRLHDIYAWQSNLEEQQRISLMMLNHRMSAEQSKRGLDESRALADMKSMSDFYTYMYEHNMLADSDLDDFVDVSEKFLGTQAALERVIKLSDGRKKNAGLISHRLRLSSYLNDYENVAKTFAMLEDLNAVTIQDAVYASNAMIYLGDENSALKAMIAPSDWIENGNDEYLDRVATLAWTCSDRELSAKVQEMLLERDSPAVNSYYLVNSIDRLDGETATKLFELYRSNHDLTLLGELLNFASEQDEELLEDIFAYIEKGAVFGSSMLLPYRAAYAVKKENYAEAEKIYEKMLSTNPYSLEAIDGLCSLALLQNDREKAEKLYRRYTGVFESSSQSFVLAANLADTLGLKKEALYWYRKYLNLNPEPDLVNLLAIASLLEDTGDVSKAYRIRKYIVKTKTAQLAALDDNSITLASVVSSLLSHDRAIALIERELGRGHANAQTATYYLSVLLSENSVLKSSYMRASKELSALKIPDYLELLYAIRTSDRKKIASILEKGTGLEDPLRYDGLVKINRTLDAYRMAKERIGRTGSQDSDAALRSLAAADRQSCSRTLQALYTNVTSWGVHRSTVNYHAPYSFGENHGQYSLSTSHQNSHAPSGLERKTVGSEIRLTGDISLDSEKSVSMVGLDLADGVGDNRLGLKASFDYNFDNRYSAGIEAGVNQHSTLSHMMMLMGKDSYVQLSFSASPYGKETFTFTAGRHYYRSRFSESLADGYDLSATLISPVFMNDPSLSVYLSGAYQKNHLKDNALVKSNLYNGPVFSGLNADTGLAEYTFDSVTAGTYLSEKYRHIAVGLTLGHGQVQSAGSGSTSLHYLIDVATGYNFEEKKIDAAVQFGIGSSVLCATDELSLSGSLQTADRQGDKAFTMTVGYSLEF